MPTLYHFFKHVSQYGTQHRTLYIVSTMLFFFVLFDGILSFASPLVIVEAGISESMMGIIISTSSIAGMIFDFILCKWLRRTSYRRIFMFMLLSAIAYPLLLGNASTVLVFLIAVAIWGLYYDLLNLGIFDYVGTQTKANEHVSSFGVIRFFQSLGYIIAPLIAGLLITDVITMRPFVVAIIFWAIALVFLLYLNRVHEKQRSNGSATEQPLNYFKELVIWKKIGTVLLPVLLLTFILNVIESTFWTIGPLVSDDMEGVSNLGSLLLFAYQLPALFVGWVAGGLTRKHGKKRTAFTSLLVGCALLSTIFLWGNIYLLILVILVGSFFVSLAWPSINGAFADYISESPAHEKDIEALEDTFTNLGFIIGPIFAGISGEHLGNLYTFSIIGGVGVVMAIILLFTTPKKITIPV